MGVGPITIYDKSALQSLTMDESVWLDAFFAVNVVPLFYVETLADLEKAIAGGKSPEELVGMLAEKTPSNATPNVHHQSLIAGELLGHAVPMDGRVPIAAGDYKRAPDDKVGVHVDEFPEAAALNRWRSYEFLEIEREFARRWRSKLADADLDRTVGILRNILPRGTRASDLGDLKRVIDAACEHGDAALTALALEVVGVPDEAAAVVMRRWEAVGGPRLESFAPYTTHVFKVDLLYYLGIDRGFISADRASNRVDMAYLYYLPFCMVFTSGDKLHRRTVPLFLRSDQSFVEASDLKAGLQELDVYFDCMPDEIKALGVMGFAHYPPTAIDNLAADLWDRHMRPDWREFAETPEQALARFREREQGGDATELIGRIEAARPTSDADASRVDGEPDYVVIRRVVPARKGKWRLVPDGIDGAAGTSDA